MSTLKKVRTEKQIEAARLNGARSQGPVTLEGKLNSARAGAGSLLVGALVLDGESKERFAALVVSLCEELQPETDIEMGFVETLAICRWRQRRILGMEKAAITGESARRPDIEGPAERITRAYRDLTLESRWLDSMNRFENRFARQYSRTLREFREYRASRTREN